MRNRIKFMIVAIFIGMSSQLQAAADELITRDLIMTGESKYKRVYLDEQVYHYAQEDLSDIRIIDEKGQEVPYYSCSAESGISLKEDIYLAEMIEEYIKDDKSYIDVKVEQEENTDIMLNFLELEVDSNNFATTVTMQGSYDGLHWKDINSGNGEEIFNVAADRKMRIYFNKPVKYSYFRLAIPKLSQDIHFTEILGGYEEECTDISNYKLMKEIPYKMEEDKEKKATILMIDNSDHLSIEDMMLKIKGEFNRAYELTGINADGTEVMLCNGWISDFTYLKENDDHAYIDLSGRTSVPTLKLTIMNEDDQPLPIKGVEVGYIIDKLVFAAQPGVKYKLTYGDNERKSPHYDIIYNEDTIEKKHQDIITLGAVEGTEIQKKSEPDYGWIYKLLIGATSILLIFVIIGSGRKKNHSN